jgi:hypothetical protein
LLPAVVGRREAAIREGIVYRFAVIECHYSENPVPELWHSAPEADASVWLLLAPEWVGQNSFAPLSADVGTFP